MLITPGKLLINSRVRHNPFPRTALHLVILTQSPQQMTPLSVLQQRFFQIHVSLLDQHVNDTGVFDLTILFEAVADHLCGSGQRGVNIIDCQNAWYFPVWNKL